MVESVLTHQFCRSFKAPFGGEAAVDESVVDRLSCFSLAASSFEGTDASIVVPSAACSLLELLSFGLSSELVNVRTPANGEKALILNISYVFWGV